MTSCSYISFLKCSANMHEDQKHIVSKCNIWIEGEVNNIEFRGDTFMTKA